MNRGELVSALDDLLSRYERGHVLRVGIDGPDAAGKTTLADELAVPIRGRRPVIRLSMDEFHRPAAVRRQRGPLSPEGFYRDSFDHDAVADSVLRPLGPGGDRRYLAGAYDHRFDAPTEAPVRTAPEGALLLFDGVFLLRPELRYLWDVSIYLHVDPDVTLDRARVRDRELFGSVAAVEDRYRRRYLPGQELYRAEAAPADAATVVLDMNDPSRPEVIRWPA